ncbi:hypothetical protein CGZ91_08860 [Parenemella sanctibonifatiensis]|uniref:Uncharacterized protein n=2 Tax=Parenemella sanctibonifatiensis TaxID=2016505 RepID=A0A255EFF0_9ACTN|nr:hypothetical protein CGZ92_13105 [Parenemella sanctibonifatiensis]OYN90264.1 hypothetical protein CGZ91_08860 [Parenemella sanctibonifatiensis]
MLAGWTVDDIAHALDRRPDERPHGQPPDNGEWVIFNAANGVADGRLGHWMTWRLAHWRTDTGDPMESPLQRSERRHAAELIQRRAEARAVRERREQRRALAADWEAQGRIRSITNGIRQMLAGRRRR